MANAPNTRASLLAGLRTGGVRSSSITVPHTAAPGASFNVPRFASQNYPAPLYEDEEDQLVELPAFNNHYSGARAVPLTAAVDGHNNSFSVQQMGQRGLNPNSVPFTPGFNSNVNVAPPSNHNQVQNQAFQMQMLQLEMLRIQQAQQLQAQADLMAQAQRQLQMQNQARERRASTNFIPPSTAGPMTNTFDPRSTAPNVQMRRNQAEILRSQLGVGGGDEVPMTAALGGKFGSRIPSLNTAAGYAPASEAYNTPAAANSTTVISGGTSLGNLAANGAKVVNNPPSKSDSASSWRRGGNNNSVLSGNNRTVSSPSVKITPPPETVTESPSLPAKFRPQPLRFSGATTQPLPAVTIDTSDSTDNDDTSSVSSSSPDTPRSATSSGPSLSPREEASKKLYEGLGIGRPVSASSDHQIVEIQAPFVTSVPIHRMVSQPTRQPRGPPSGADELGPKNFATRIRRHAIDGLGALMGARERRELVEAY
jgi:hypothetical protein